MTSNHPWLARSAALAAVVVLGGCSWSTEDERITFCKDLLENMQPAGTAVSWLEPEVTIQRPSHAITRVKRSVEDASSAAGPLEAECWYAFEIKGAHSAAAVAQPLEEYATLPYQMTVEGQQLSDAELRQAINAEQIRRGKALIDTLKKGATDVADQVRAGIGG